MLLHVTFVIFHKLFISVYYCSVVDLNALNLDPDLDPGFWPNLDPDPELGLNYQF